jgi:hypothetical protein
MNTFHFADCRETGPSRLLRDPADIGCDHGGAVFNRPVIVIDRLRRRGASYAVVVPVLAGSSRKQADIGMRCSFNVTAKSTR